MLPTVRQPREAQGRARVRRREAEHLEERPPDVAQQHGGHQAIRALARLARGDRGGERRGAEGGRERDQDDGVHVVGAPSRSHRRNRHAT